LAAGLASAMHGIRVAIVAIDERRVAVKIHRHEKIFSLLNVRGRAG
jgi:hypothetical protein